MNKKERNPLVSAIITTALFAAVAIIGMILHFTGTSPYSPLTITLMIICAVLLAVRWVLLFVLKQGEPTVGNDANPRGGEPGVPSAADDDTADLDTDGDTDAPDDTADSAADDDTADEADDETEDDE